MPKIVRVTPVALQAGALPLPNLFLKVSSEENFILYSTALFHWPFPKAVSTRDVEKRLFSKGQPQAFQELLMDTLFVFFQSFISCLSLKIKEDF